MVLRGRKKAKEINVSLLVIRNFNGETDLETDLETDTNQSALYGKIEGITVRDYNFDERQLKE